MQWYQLPQWNEAEIEQSVELNVALDLKRMGPLLQPKGERLEKLRRLVRAEVENEIHRERRDVQRGFSAGVALFTLGLGSVLISMLLRRPKQP